MSYANEKLQRVKETIEALMEANNLNDTAHDNLVMAQDEADNAQQDVDELTTLLKELFSDLTEEPTPENKIKAVLKR